MGEEEPNGSFMDTWLDSTYIYDIYDTNDGYYMTVMTQVIFEGVAAATVLPKFLKFWAPHDFALFLIVGSFHFLVLF